MIPENITTSFDDDLKRLDNIIAEMGGLAEVQLADAIDALLKRDANKAALVIASDKQLDALEALVDGLAVQMLASRQPIAENLRIVITALKTASVIERIGDYAKNIAKRSVAISQSKPIGATKTIGRMGGQVQNMIKNVLDAYMTRDASKAEDVRASDGDVDALHTSLFRELLTYMMEDPSHITACTHLLFIAKNIERIGDHATNIAENVHFLVHGNAITEERLKEDESSFIVVEHMIQAELKESKQ
tara:strand:+ start:606 stop:1346 length:741 start_codon:yes stop_codon:yes gene_type:complete